MSRLLRPFIVSSLKKASTDMPAYHKFIKMNKASEKVTGEFPKYTLDYSKLTVSKGKLPTIETGEITCDGLNMAVTWKSKPNQKASDSSNTAVVLLINETVRSFKSYFENVKRSAEKVDIVIPGNWSGQTVHVYLQFKKVEKKVFSDSSYIGNVIINRT